jgi:hypothetical protein
MPFLLHLPDLENNLIEGVVIKPLSHSALKELEFRPIIKVKNSEFDEEKKFHEAEKWSFVPKISSNSEEIFFIIEEMANYLNKNRVDSAVSKIGKIDFGNEKKLQEIQNEILSDIWTDFNENTNKLLEDLAENQQNWVKKRLKALIKEYMANLG